MFLDCAFAIVSYIDDIAIFAQQVEEQLAHCPIVVDNENACGVAAAGDVW